MRRNNQTNRLIKWMVAIGDFFLLNTILMVFSWWHPNMVEWDWGWMRHFLLFCNMGLFVAEWRYHTIIHERLPSGGQMLQRIVLLVMTWMITSYLLQKTVGSMTPVGWLMVQQGIALFIVLLIARLLERTIIKWYRQRGGNTRQITFVGSDPELMSLYEQLVNNPTTGYRALGYYGDASLTDSIQRLGSLEDFLEKIDRPEELVLGDELYLCVSHQERDMVMRVSRMCDRQMVRFFYVPVSSETIGLNLKGELIEDREVFTTYENPLQNPLNKVVKRILDIVMASFLLLLTALLFPFIWLKIKIQSPGPVFFSDRSAQDWMARRLRC